MDSTQSVQLWLLLETILPLLLVSLGKSGREKLVRNIEGKELDMIWISSVAIKVQVTRNTHGVASFSRGHTLLTIVTSCLLHGQSGDMSSFLTQVSLFNQQGVTTYQVGVVHCLLE